MHVLVTISGFTALRMLCFKKAKHILNIHAIKPKSWSVKIRLVLLAPCVIFGEKNILLFVIRSCLVV